MKPRRAAPHVFGPVPSRRLGRSLGVDLVPFKTCSYDCVYCQLGPTTHKRATPQTWAPVEAVLAEAKRKLDCRPDYLTLSGSGEPTLYAPLGEVIAGLQRLTSTPVALLTNGSLFWRPEVRAAARRADVVIPSLDAGNPVQFRAINRPHADISFERMIEGLMAFRRDFRGQFWLEIMLVNGFTSLKSQVADLVEHVRRLRPDKVQLNTVVRPPPEEYAQPVPEARLRELARLFPPPTEIIATAHRPASGAPEHPSETALLALLQRRPCTVEDVTVSLGLKPVEAFKWLEALETRGRIVSRSHEGAIYYQAPPAAKASPAGDSVVPSSP